MNELPEDGTFGVETCRNLIIHILYFYNCAFVGWITNNKECTAHALICIKKHFRNIIFWITKTSVCIQTPSLTFILKSTRSVLFQFKGNNKTEPNLIQTCREHSIETLPLYLPTVVLPRLHDIPSPLPLNGLDKLNGFLDVLTTSIDSGCPGRDCCTCRAE